jgi:phage shock protein A
LQLEGLRGAIGEVAKKQQHEREKVAGLQEAVGKVRHQIESITIPLTQTAEAVGRRVGLLERAASGLAEAKDRTSQVESDVAVLRAPMADGSARVEEFRREVAGLKAELWDCCPKAKKDLTNLEQELAKVKEEIRAMRPIPELLAPAAAYAAVLPAQKAPVPAGKSSNGSSSSPLDVTSPTPKFARLKLLPLSAPPKAVKQFLPSVKDGKIEREEGCRMSQKRVEVGIDAPDPIIARGLSGRLGELIAVVSLRGGSSVAGGLSARGLVNVGVRNWSDDFTFIMGDHRFRCASSVAQFLSPCVSKLQLIDATISELRLEVEDEDGLFDSVLKAAEGGSIVIDSARRRTFEGICAALSNSCLYQCVEPDPGEDVTMQKAVDRLRFLPATRCDISSEFEFIASHFYDFLCPRDGLNAVPFS